MVYQKDKDYKIKFVTTDGETKEIDLKPEKDLSTPQVIQKLKNEDKKFFKLLERKEIKVEREYQGIKYIDNVDGKCPVCNADLYYDAVEHVDGDMEYYPWECKNCGTRGEAWFKEVFNGHTIITPDTDDNIDLPLDESRKHLNSNKTKKTENKEFSLYNSHNIPYALSNEFDNIPEFKEDIEDADRSKYLDIINKYAKYDKFKEFEQNKNAIKFKCTDSLGNVTYLRIIDDMGQEGTGSLKNISLTNAEGTNLSLTYADLDNNKVEDFKTEINKANKKDYINIIKKYSPRNDVSLFKQNDNKSMFKIKAPSGYITYMTILEENKEIKTEDVETPKKEINVMEKKLNDIIREDAEAEDWYGYEDEKEFNTLTLEEKLDEYLQNNYLEDLANALNIDTYVSDHKTYLQLSDSPVLNFIDNDEFIGSPDFEAFYGDEVTSWLQDFEDKMQSEDLLEGEVGMAGRMGKHIVIDANAKNIINYSKLKSKYEDLENEFIEYMNNYKID